MIEKQASFSTLFSRTRRSQSQTRLIADYELWRMFVEPNMNLNSTQHLEMEVKMIKEQIKLPFGKPPQPKKNKQQKNRDTGGRPQPAHALAKKVIARLNAKGPKKTARFLYLAVQTIELVLSLSGSL